ncbi:uncharacterized protein LOC114532890 [Dendronephthya gigantea]|uniref:uncharacterized protein LOC114532890 n=1 Tax=Dendronephthya gigantea TaxID=151771 RepID=UPI00106C93EF|nr:uncharacterized protein LOC114532890 [Dendronephthya gigantea]
MYLSVIIIAIFAAVFPASVRGHGMMMDPVNRASRWRKGYGGPKEYTDNQLSCGGRNVQWGKHKSKCGVCAWDEYGIANPKFHYPWEFAKNAPIMRSCQEGQKIEVKIRIMTNHLGYFTFRLAPLTQQPITQNEKRGLYTITLQLPKGVTCYHCVMQWWWSTGNNWVCNLCSFGLRLNIFVYACACY